MNFREILEQETQNQLQLLSRSLPEYIKEAKNFRYPTPWDINNGSCEDWAENIAKKIPEAEAVWLDQLDPEIDPLDVSHCVVSYLGKFYDAECIDGVQNFNELPLMKNSGKKTREQVILERGWAK